MYINKKRISKINYLHYVQLGISQLNGKHILATLPTIYFLKLLERGMKESKGEYANHSATTIWSIQIW